MEDDRSVWPEDLEFDVGLYGPAVEASYPVSSSYPPASGAAGLYLRFLADRARLAVCGLELPFAMSGDARIAAAAITLSLRRSIFRWTVQGGLARRGRIVDYAMKASVVSTEMILVNLDHKGMAWPAMGEVEQNGIRRTMIGSAYGHKSTVPGAQAQHILA